MTIEVKLDLERAIIVATLSEPWSPKEMTEIIDHVRDEPGFDISMGTLLDFRAITEMPTVADIEVYSAFFGSQDERRGVKRALVVSSDLQYGMARMASAHSEGHGLQVAVFKDLESAYGWLAAEP
jgi:hypothetical protein